ncbi:MAG: PKD domain-containing protein, partial [Chloroflexota bacterium]
MRHRRIPLLLLIVGLLAGGVVFAAADGLVQFVLTGGGGRSEVDTSVLRGSVGQAIAGRGAGGDGVLCAGWPGCQSVTSSLPAPLLLVDDDDNTPDARPDYETVLNALDVRYHVWDTGGADNEPDAATLAAYQAVIWFSGANAGPYAGPGPAAESALAAWLDGGGCLFITAQDAIYRGGSGTVTPFMQSYLGLSPTSGQEVDYSIVQGQGSQFGGLGPFTFGTPLPYTAAVDELLPDGTADTALVGSGAGEAYSAAVSKDGGAYRTTFWGFPLDFLARADQRAALNTILDWCQVDIPVAGLAASNDSPTVLGQTTAFSATISAGTLVSYTWDFGDGHFGSGQTASHDYAAAGTYTATVTAGNALNSQFAETTVVVAEPIAGLAAASDSPTALGQSTAFTATLGAGAGVGVEYTWDFGDGHIGAGATTSHLYELPGNYLAQVTAINPVSSQTAQTAVDVLRPVSGLEAASSSPTALGAGTAFTATVSGGDDLVYEWEFGDGAGAFGAMANHTYAASGTYTATVTATNSVSGQSADVPITVIEGVGGLTASSDSPTVLGQSTTLTATVATGDGLVYSWDFGDGLGDSGA